MELYGLSTHSAIPGLRDFEGLHRGPGFIHGLRSRFRCSLSKD